MSNDLQFSSSHQSEHAVPILSLNYAKNVTRAFNFSGNNGSNHDYRLISWTFPLSVCVKINTDGSSSGGDCRGSFGGLVRTDHGKWVEGFVGYIGYMDALKAELWGIGTLSNHARKETGEESLLKMIAQLQLISSIMMTRKRITQIGILVDDCKELKNETEAPINHILREANWCADVLAKMGGEQSEQEVSLLVPPNEVVEEMMCDMRGVAYGRGM